MGKMTAEEVNVSLFDEVKRLQSENASLRKKIESMEEDVCFYECLRASGVYNWDGYDYAIEMMEAKKGLTHLTCKVDNKMKAKAMPQKYSNKNLKGLNNMEEKEKIESIAKQIQSIIEDKAYEYMDDKEKAHFKFKQLFDFIKNQREFAHKVKCDAQKSGYNAESLMAEGGMAWLDTIIDFTEDM